MKIGYMFRTLLAGRIHKKASSGFYVVKNRNKKTISHQKG